MKILKYRASVIGVRDITPIQAEKKICSFSRKNALFGGHIGGNQITKQISKSVHPSKLKVI